jgi:hypothetical protein
MRRSLNQDDFKAAIKLMQRPREDPEPGDIVLPDGNCYVCERYERHGNYILAAFDKDELERWRPFQPLQEEPDLFLRFARVWQEPDFTRTALDFAHRYGLPCDTTPRHPRWPPAQLSLRRFFEESRRAWVVLSLYESVVNRDETAAKRLLAEQREDDFFGRFYGWYVAKPWPPDDAFSLTSARQCALAGSLHATESVVKELCEQQAVVFPGYAEVDPSSVKVTWSFKNLLGAMYLQMWWLITSGGNLARCEHCSRLISLSRSNPEGRKRRRDKRFCDDACRQAHHRDKKKRAQDAPS